MMCVPKRADFSFVGAFNTDCFSIEIGQIIKDIESLLKKGD